MSLDVISDACSDAILDYIARPHRFDITRGIPLDRFLQYAAARNMFNYLKAETRRRTRETRYAQECSLDSLSHTVGPGEREQTRREILALVNNASERAALQDWLDGERDSARLAITLGLSHLTPMQQQREVKRFKDRVLKRLSRHYDISRRAR